MIVRGKNQSELLGIKQVQIKCITIPRHCLGFSREMQFLATLYFLRNNTIYLYTAPYILMRAMLYVHKVIHKNTNKHIF